MEQRAVGEQTETECQICRQRDKPRTRYRYYLPQDVAVLYDIGTSRTTRYTYSSSYYREVSICDRCVAEKRARAKMWHWIGLLISLLLTPFLVGLFGVIGFAMGLLKLRRKEEVGDILACNWGEHKKYQFAWLRMEHCLTRREFDDAPHAAPQAPKQVPPLR